MQLRKLIGKALAVLLLLQPLLFAQSAAGFRFHSAGGDSLTGFFQSFWKLADVNDSIGSNNLSNTGTVTFSAGHIGNAANFSHASTQRLTHADAASLRLGNQKWTVSAWFDRTNTTGAQYIVTKLVVAGSATDFRLRGNSGAETLLIDLYNGTTQVAAFASIAAANNAWHLIVVWFDPTVGTHGTLYYSLDGGAAQSTAASAAPTTVCDTNCNFAIGGTANTGDTWNGQIDAVGFRQGAIPTAGQIALLYAAGVGWEP